MATIEEPSRWRFSRHSIAVGECANQLKQLQKHLNARIKKLQPGKWKCVKLNRASDVHFHRIDVERASQCLLLVVHSFHVEDATTLDACGKVAEGQGYYYDFLCFDGPGINFQWIKKEQVGNSSVSWEQTAESGTADPDLWRNRWRGAAEKLGLRELLREVDVDGISYPEVMVPATTNTDYGRMSQTVEDVEGMRLVVVRYPGPKLTFWLGMPEPTRARNVWAKCTDAADAQLGPIQRRFMTLEYNGREKRASERLNEIVPQFHLVNYNLWDDEKDKFYRQMLKPMTLPIGTTRAFPALTVTEDEIAERPHLVVNVVRSSAECWLEFQTDLPEFFFPEINQALGSAVDVWTKAPEGRWNW